MWSHLLGRHSTVNAFRKDRGGFIYNTDITFLFLTHDYIIKILAALIIIFISVSAPYHGKATYEIKMIAIIKF